MALDMLVIGIYFRNKTNRLKGQGPAIICSGETSSSIPRYPPVSPVSCYVSCFGSQFLGFHSMQITCGPQRIQNVHCLATEVRNKLHVPSP